MLGTTYVANPALSYNCMEKRALMMVLRFIYIFYFIFLKFLFIINFNIVVHNSLDSILGACAELSHCYE